MGSWLGRIVTHPRLGCDWKCYTEGKDTERRHL
jgi:hypothetical protein